MGIDPDQIRRARALFCRQLFSRRGQNCWHDLRRIETVRGLKLFAKFRGELLGQSMLFGAQPQDGVVRRAGLLFKLLQRIPGLQQEFVAPALEKAVVIIERGAGLVHRVGGIVRDLQRLFDSSPMMIGDQTKQHTLEVLAKTTSLGIGTSQTAFQKLNGKVLKNLVRRVSVFQRREDISANSSPVLLQDLLPCLASRLALFAVGSADDRPQGCDLREALIAVFVHRR